MFYGLFHNALLDVEADGWVDATLRCCGNDMAMYDDPLRFISVCAIPLQRSTRYDRKKMLPFPVALSPVREMP